MKEQYEYIDIKSTITLMEGIQYFLQQGFSLGIRDIIQRMEYKVLKNLNDIFIGKTKYCYHLVGNKTNGKIQLVWNLAYGTIECVCINHKMTGNGCGDFSVKEYYNKQQSQENNRIIYI